MEISPLPSSSTTLKRPVVCVAGYLQTMLCLFDLLLYSATLLILDQQCKNWKRNGKSYLGETGHSQFSFSMIMWQQLRQKPILYRTLDVLRRCFQQSCSKSNKKAVNDCEKFLIRVSRIWVIQWQYFWKIPKNSVTIFEAFDLFDLLKKMLSFSKEFLNWSL